jgi:hypothetical protein
MIWQIGDLIKFFDKDLDKYAHGIIVEFIQINNGNKRAKIVWLDEHQPTRESFEFLERV